MRTTADRIRHVVSFEIIGLALAVPLATLAFDHSVFEMGVVGLGSSLVATGWNYVFNVIFDRVLHARAGTTLKTVRMRVLHAVLFELGLLAMLAPLIALYLGIGLWEALVLDLGFALFYMVYALVFNWAYDRLFPLPEWEKTAA
jgi:uncharacterized membrane protein